MHGNRNAYCTASRAASARRALVRCAARSLAFALACTVAAPGSAWAHERALPRADDDAKPAAVGHAASIERVRDERGAEIAERVLAEVHRGSIEISVDAKLKATAIDAEFTVDGTDAKDIERRAKLVSLYAVRASDGTIVATPVFPGKPMQRDSVRLVIRVPAASDSSFKTVEGSIVVRGTSGELRVATKSGSIAVSGHTGMIDARSESGAIELKGATEAVKVRSASGAIAVLLADGNDHPFEAESKSGTIAIEVGSAFDGTVRLVTARGSVTLSDPAKIGRVTESDMHAVTVELGAAAAHSDVHSMDGSLSITVRAKDPK